MIRMPDTAHQARAHLLLPTLAAPVTRIHSGCNTIVLIYPHGKTQVYRGWEHKVSGYRDDIACMQRVILVRRDVFVAKGDG